MYLSYTPPIERIYANQTISISPCDVQKRVDMFQYLHVLLQDRLQ